MATRREFLSDTCLTSAAPTLTPLPACSQQATPTAQPATPARRTHVGDLAPDTLPLRKIPSSGEFLPAIGVGTSGSYEVDIDSPRYAALHQVLKLFFDAGGRVIDTSPNYSNAEEVVGALLDQGGWRRQCFLATKLAADDVGALRAQWRHSQHRLRTETVDLLQVHNLRNTRQALPYARNLKQSGAVRYVGLTHYVEHAHAELAQLMRAEKPDFIQINYSVAAPQAARTLFPLAEELGIAVIVNRAFDDGRLFAAASDKALPGWAAEMQVGSWAQMFLRFVLSQPAVTVVIPATGKPERQADNLKGGIGPLLSSAQQDELIKLFA